MTSVHLTVCLFICLTRPPQLAYFIFLLQTHTPHPLPQCVCWRDPTKVPLIKIGCRVKKERVCGTFAQVHTPRVCMLEGPYKSTLHKNRVSSIKRACVWDLYPGAHPPVSTLELPYESTLHKNRVSSKKRACVWDLCPGTHSHPLPPGGTLQNYPT
jgi:hypothetical protein